MTWVLWLAALATAGDPPTDPKAPKPLPPKVVTEIQVIPAMVQGTVKLVLAGRDGDRVYIDGWNAGSLPVETELAEGPHIFRVEGEKGKHEVSIYVTPAAGKVTEVDLSVPVAAPTVPPATP